MKIMCAVKGCQSSVNISNPFFQDVKYTCKEHSIKADDKIRFQEYAFNPEIGTGTDPKAYERGSGNFGKIKKRKR